MYSRNALIKYAGAQRNSRLWRWFVETVVEARKRMFSKLSRSHGACPVECHDVYIGHPSIWGNPFKIGIDGNREEVIEQYENYIRNNPYLMERLMELEGKTLGCWCKPKPCHGDVLVKLIKEKNNIYFK